MAGAQAIAAGEGLHADPEAELNHILYRLDRLTEAAWDQHSAPAEDLVFTLEQVHRRVAYLQTRALNMAEADAAWRASGGSYSITSWLTSVTGAPRALAAKMVKTSRAMRDHLPEAAQALANGRISAEHGHIMARVATKTHALREQLRNEDVGEEFLVDSAATMGAGEFSKVAKHWAAMADPAAADRNWREESEKDEVFLSPTLGGYHLSGWLNPLSGKALEEALDASMGRKKQDDDRPPAQRRAAALVELARGWLDSGKLLPGARIRPHLTVTVPLPTLHALCEASGSAIPPQGGVTPGVSAQQTLFATGGPRDGEGVAFQSRANAGDEIDPAEWVENWTAGDGHIISTAIDFAKLVGKEPASLEDGTAIPPSVLSRLACDSRLMRVVFGPESTILDAGREKRIFPANQTRAIIARDRHCQFPDCDEPPGYGEIHHSVWWWKYGGTTSVDQGILLCWFHHGYVHDHHVTIMRRQGKWIFADRWGGIIRSVSSKAASPVREERHGGFDQSADAQSVAVREPDPPANLPNAQPKTEACPEACYHPTAEEMAYYGIPEPEDDPWGRDIHQLWQECGPRPQLPKPEWDSGDSWE